MRCCRRPSLALLAPGSKAKLGLGGVAPLSATLAEEEAVHAIATASLKRGEA